jgi:serine/threonine protein kinase
MKSHPVAGSEPLRGWQTLERVGHWHGEAWRARRASDGLEATLEIISLDELNSDRLMKALEPMLGVRHPCVLGVLFTERTPEGVIVGTPTIDYRQSLAERFRQVRRGEPVAIPHGELLRYLAMAAVGIDFLSDRYNCPHKNVRPDNMLVLGGALKLTRYGYPDAIDLIDDKTGAHSIGAQGYLAPERSGGGEATAKSDQFALAITYVELRTGSNPLIPNRFEVIAGLREPDLSALPKQERSIVSQALKAKPEQRWSSCREFVSKLGSALDPTRTST